MRRIAWALLLLFAFTIPWENSLDLGEPLGNVARIAGLLLLLAAIPAVFQAGRLRTPGLLQWAVLALYLWFCCSYFWTIDELATAARMQMCIRDSLTSPRQVPTPPPGDTTPRHRCMSFGRCWLASGSW